MAGYSYEDFWSRYQTRINYFKNVIKKIKNCINDIDEQGTLYYNSMVEKTNGVIDNDSENIYKAYNDLAKLKDISIANYNSIDKSKEVINSFDSDFQSKYNQLLLDINNYHQELGKYVESKKLALAKQGQAISRYLNCYKETETEDLGFSR